MRMMRAAVVEGPSQIVVREVPMPEEIGETSVLVRVRRATICNHSDVEWYRGRWAPPGGKYPFILGHEVSGDIVAVGKETKGLKEGDRIAAWCPGSGFADYVVIDTTRVAVVPIPPEVSYEEGAILELAGGGTMQGMWASGMRPGDRVLVLGCGPAGLCFIQHAKNFGAEIVVATDIYPFRLQKAEELGADLTINVTDMTSQEVSRVILKQVGEIDVAFDAAGTQSALEAGIEATKFGGTIVLFAHPLEVPIPIKTASCKGIRLQGMLGLISTSHIARLLKVAVRQVAEGRLNLKALITHRLPLERVEEGLHLVEESMNDTIKVVLTIE